MAEMKLGRALLFGVVALVGSFLLIMLVITGYAAYLGFQARGQPDQEAIQAFAQRFAPVAGPILGGLAALLAARWSARGLTSRAATHGLVVGLVVALPSLYSVVTSGSSVLRNAGEVALLMVAGGVGGMWASAAARRAGSGTSGA
jgi:hypothetical protein